MNASLSQSDSVNVLISDANWAWPQAVAQIFRPRGINAMVAETTNDMVQIIDTRKIHLAILDEGMGVQTMKIIRKHDKLLPCLLLAKKIDHRLLAEALKLRVFSVLAKPVDLTILAEQINRIFRKYYASNVFSDDITNVSDRHQASQFETKISIKTNFIHRKPDKPQ